MSIVPRTHLPLVICALIPTESGFSQALANLGCVPLALADRHNVGRTGNVTVLPIAHDQIEESVVLSADAVVLVLDGNLGLSPAVIDVWRTLSDWDIPRQIAVLNAVTGRADFDEVVAICERVLEDGLVVRYLPLESDDSSGVDGIYDILTSELHVRTENGPAVRSADPEHVALTAEKREILIADIAHAAMTDEQLESLVGGMPISIPAVEQAWESAGLVSVIPIDDNIAAHVLNIWYSHVEARWLPIVHGDEQTLSVDEVSIQLGIGIGKGVARMWNTDPSVLIERQRGKQSATTSDECLVGGGLLFAKEVRVGDVLRPAQTQFLLTEPRF